MINNHNINTVVIIIIIITIVIVIVKITALTVINKKSVYMKSGQSSNAHIEAAGGVGGI